MRITQAIVLELARVAKPEDREALHFFANNCVFCPHMGPDCETECHSNGYGIRAALNYGIVLDQFAPTKAQAA